MVTFNLSDASMPDEVLVNIATAVPVLPIMILVFTWFLIFLGGMQRQSKKFGYSDTPQWATMASLACFLMSLIMTMTEGIIALPILLIVVAVNVLSAVWFFLSRGRYE